MNRKSWLIPIILLAIAASACDSASTLPTPPASTPTAEVSQMKYPYNQPTSIKFNQADIDTAWREWKAAMITATNTGAAPRLRVMGGTDMQSTTSEGMSYGMTFASVLDDQATFDGLWLFVADFLDKHGLMDWHIAADRSRAGTGGATDADEDIAMALVNACTKVKLKAWPASPNKIDYCAAATAMINAVYQYEVDQPGYSENSGLDNNPGYELIPGDQWSISSDYPNGIVNLSYFAPAYYRIFGKFTNNVAAWDNVIKRNYELAATVQSKPGNCAHLVSNWNTYQGDPQKVDWQADSYMNFGWDGARFAWRVALDRAWFNDPTAQQIINQLGSFFASVGVDNIKAEYKMDGTSPNNYSAPFFTAHGATAIWAANNLTALKCGQADGTIKSTPQQGYDAVVATKDTSPNPYYNNAWRLFAMLLMSGNFPNLIQ